METSATWAECIGKATWLSEPLRRTLLYPAPLPVQQAVIPRITRALQSGVPNDVSLTAPTGSGKTLCYLLPLLNLLTEMKRGVDDTALRGVILVPSPTLGQQVFRELQRLTRSTSIKVACLVSEASHDRDSASPTRAPESVEARELVRRVDLPKVELFGDVFGSETADERTIDICDEALNSDSEDDEERSFGLDSDFSIDSGLHGATTARYFSCVDVVVATPQRLLYHLDHTRGLRLADLQLLVIDEADQVLAGNFAAQVQKVNARYEYDMQRRQNREQRLQQRALDSFAKLSSASVCASSSAMDSWIWQARSMLPITDGTAAPHRSGITLHKVLCSATLSSRIARISQVKLRNCSHYVLDSNGEERREEQILTASEANESPPSMRKGAEVRTQFVLPPRLQEHVIFVEDAYRPAVLLKLVHALRDRIRGWTAARRQAHTAAQRAEEKDAEGVVANRGKEETVKTRAVADSNAGTASYPNVEDAAGTGILVFCATAEEARVMSHFLAAAGIESVVEFTTLSSESERRRALLQHSTDANAGNANGVLDNEVSCVVASDALMRGIDIPNVGHVIMYHPPDAVSQYIHRAGRTARAMRPGHVHLLLSKMGPSGTQEDGEVALFKRLSQSLARTLPVSYERLFFRFAAAPSQGSSAQAALSASTKATMVDHRAAAQETLAAVSEDEKLEEGSAEWWVTQARQFLQLSQHQLQRHWASVLESTAAVATSQHHQQAAGNRASFRGTKAVRDNSQQISRSEVGRRETPTKAVAPPPKTDGASRKRSRHADAAAQV